MIPRIMTSERKASALAGSTTDMALWLIEEAHEVHDALGLHKGAVTSELSDVLGCVGHILAHYGLRHHAALILDIQEDLGTLSGAISPRR